MKTVVIVVAGVVLAGLLVGGGFAAWSWREVGVRAAQERIRQAENEAAQRELVESAQRILALNQQFNVNGIQECSGFSSGPANPAAGTVPFGSVALKNAGESIDVLQLPKNVTDALRTSGLKTVGELAAKPQPELAAIKGIDPAIRAIGEAIAKQPRTDSVSVICP